MVEFGLVSLNIKDPAAVAAITEVARLLGVSKTAAVRQLAQEKLKELGAPLTPEQQAKYDEAIRFMQEHIWPITAGVKPMTKEEEEEFLGYDELYT